MEKQASQVSTEDFQNGFKSSKVHDMLSSSSSFMLLGKVNYCSKVQVAFQLANIMCCQKLYIYIYIK